MTHPVSPEDDPEGQNEPHFESSDFLDETAGLIIESRLSPIDRLQELTDQEKLDLPNICKGKICPILSELAVAHFKYKYNVSANLVIKEELNFALLIKKHYDKLREDLFGRVMESVSNGSMTLEFGDALLDFSASDNDNNGGELLLLEKIDVKNQQIAEDTSKLKRLEELHRSLQNNEQPPSSIKRVSVILGKFLKHDAKVDECLGADFVSDEIDDNKKFICSYPSAQGVLHQAIDEGLVKLD